MTTFDVPTYTLPISITLRTAEKRDLPLLEWHGEFRHYRNLFRRAYREQLRGRRLMLLADYNNFPIGQVFIQFQSTNNRIADGKFRAYFYSLRVMNIFRGQGIGTWLMREAETALLSRGFKLATIAVAKENHGALRLYERLGYERFAEDPGEWNYINHRGEVIEVTEPCWILEKFL